MGLVSKEYWWNWWHLMWKWKFIRGLTAYVPVSDRGEVGVEVEER